MSEIYTEYLNKIILVQRFEAPTLTGELIAIHDDFIELENRQKSRMLIRKDQVLFVAEVPRRPIYGGRT